MGTGTILSKISRSDSQSPEFVSVGTITPHSQLQPVSLDLNITSRPRSYLRQFSFGSFVFLSLTRRPLCVTRSARRYRHDT
jgi:hypothetical protein